MNKGRKKDHLWQFVKYRADIGVYAKCSCGFHYFCCKGNNLHFMPDPERLYNYCPLCGSRKKRYIDEIEYIDKYRWE